MENTAMQNWLRRMATFQAAAFIGVLTWGAYQGVSAIQSAPAQQRLRPTLTLEAFLAGRRAVPLATVQLGRAAGAHRLQQLALPQRGIAPLA